MIPFRTKMGMCFWHYDHNNTFIYYSSKRIRCIYKHVPNRRKQKGQKKIHSGTEVKFFYLFQSKYFKDNFVLFERYVRSYDEQFQILMDRREIHEHHGMH